MFKYFNNCKSIEDVKATYKSLAKKYHPDIAGAEFTATMQEINSEFEKAFDKYKNIHTAENGDNYTTEQQTTETPAEFMEIINKLINCEGLNIELVGRWIWLSGNSYPYKDIIKSLDFKWASNKKAWYWHSENDGTANKRSMSLDKIKEKYGCTSFQTNSRMAIA
jgi:curved DNA-binding protein CbpA